MKKITSAIIITALLTALTACGNTENSSSTSLSTADQSKTSAPESSDSVSTPSSDNESAPQSSKENSPADSAPSEPVGESTFLIGLDGKAILTNEITRLENTDKTAETLTEDDLWAEAYCEGFAYVKEPTGVAFNSYKNPELFDGYFYLGDEVENTNEWKRVYVGDEICGLKVKSAYTHFEIPDFSDRSEDEMLPLSERYLSLQNTGGCELEGTIELEGFLQVFPNSAMYPDTSELVEFLPCESKLPITPSWQGPEDRFTTSVKEQALLDHFGDPGIFGELDSIQFGTLSKMTCDMDGIGHGDIAYVRVTLGNIKCMCGGISATLENVERISDILIHDEDDTETHQPASVR